MVAIHGDGLRWWPGGGGGWWWLAGSPGVLVYGVRKSIMMKGPRAHSSFDELIGAYQLAGKDAMVGKMGELLPLLAIDDLD